MSRGMVNHIFEEVDRDGNGEIDYEELDMLAPYFSSVAWTPEVKAAILLHLDKHGSVLGIYSEEKVEAEAVLQGLCDQCGGLLVPFAIPPMLARWDRALSELKAIWPDAEAFPVPEAAEQTWIPRNARRGRGKKPEPEPAAEE